MTVNRWPDEAERAERRAKLHADLDTYLDDFVTDEGQGGFAKVTREHIHGLEMLVYEMIMLKFQRDEDSTIVVRPHFENLRYGMMVHATLPNKPGMHRSEEDWLRWEMDTSRAAASLMNDAVNAMQHVSGRIRDRYVAMAQNREIDEQVAEVQALVDAGDFAAAEKLADHLTIGSNTGLFLDAAPTGRIQYPRISDKNDPRIEQVRAIIAKALFGELAQARDMVSNVLERYKNAAPTDTSIEQTTHALLQSAYKRFGRAAFQDQLERYEAIGTTRRAARKTARQAKSKT